LTVMVATRTGMPVSTTHALTGGLVGAGLLAAPDEIQLAALGDTFVLPLLLSPVVAILLTVLIYPLFRWSRRRSGTTRDLCIFVGTTYEHVSLLPDGTVALARTGVTVEFQRTEDCVEHYQGRMLGLEAGRIVDVLHFISGGAVGFARGLNDTPKIVALLLAGETIHPTLGLAAVALVMAVGGVLNARRVAETMSRKITRMSPGQGFTANLVTALLVAGASRLGCRFQRRTFRSVRCSGSAS